MEGVGCDTAKANVYKAAKWLYFPCEESLFILAAKHDNSATIFLTSMPQLVSMKFLIVLFKLSGLFFLLCHPSVLAGILTFSTLHLDHTSMRATASYSFEGLVAAAIEPCAADCGRVSAIVCESRFLSGLLIHRGTTISYLTR